MITRLALQKNFDRVARQFDQNDYLFQEINRRQIERLQYMDITPTNILDCGCGTGMGSQLLARKYKKSHIICLDLSEAMLRCAGRKKRWLQSIDFIKGDAKQLPFATNSIDFIYSNLMLHWNHPTEDIFSEWQRVLKPNGLLMFSTFGPDTLQELRDAVQALNPEFAVPMFVDMHNIGDDLIKCKFLDPVMDVDNIRLQYASSKAFLNELRALGGRNLNVKPRFKSKQYYFSLLQNLAQEKLAVSFEIVYGHAWASELSQQSQKDNVVSIPLQNLKIRK